MIFNIANAPHGVSFNTPIFTYTGTAPQLFTDGDDWELVFTGDCEITFLRVSPTVDVFLCGGGNPGGSGDGYVLSASNSKAEGGAGGKGGECKTVSLSVSTGIPYTIKVGGSGQSTSAFGQSASNGGGSNGGDGAVHKTPSTRTNAGDGTGGVYAFGEENTLYAAGQKYGAGGAGGSAYSTLGGNTATAGTGVSNCGGSGGSSAEGNGGRGENGAAKTGGGGGGGGTRMWNSGNVANCFTGSGGSGGSGIVIMRNARAA